METKDGSDICNPILRLKTQKKSNQQARVLKAIFLRSVAFNYQYALGQENFCLHLCEDAVLDSTRWLTIEPESLRKLRQPHQSYSRHYNPGWACRMFKIDRKSHTVKY